MNPEHLELEGFTSGSEANPWKGWAEIEHERRVQLEEGLKQAMASYLSLKSWFQILLQCGLPIAFLVGVVVGSLLSDIWQ